MKRIKLPINLTLTLLLIFATSVSAQQRFLKILGQRPAGSTNTSLSALVPVQPFYARVMTGATLVAALVDETGAVVSTENQLRVELQLSSPKDGHFPRVLGSCVRTTATAINGIFEFFSLYINGRTSTSLTLSVVKFPCPPTDKDCLKISDTVYAKLPSLPMTIELRGGKPFIGVWLKLKNGKYAVPGQVNGLGKFLEGATPNIQMGKSVQFSNADTTDVNIITLQTFDWYGNVPSFSTVGSLTLAGGEPRINPIQTPQLNNRTWTDATTGIAQFPNYQVLGVTSNNVQMTFDVGSSADICPDRYIYFLGISPTSSTLNLIASDAVAITPVMIPDSADTLQYARVPSRMTIGKTAPTFYAQAVDEYGNRVSGDPYDPNGGYNGGVATISFPAPGVPILNPNGSTSAVMNTRQWSATGITATAVRGLYTFHQFTPTAPALITSTTMTMVFSDPALPGAPHPLQPFTFPFSIFNSLPPVTTANTTVQPGVVSVSNSRSQSPPQWQIHPNPTADYTTLHWETTERGAYHIRLFSVLGVEVWHKQGWAEVGESKRDIISLTGLPAGFYIVELQTASAREAQRLLKLQ